MFTSWKLGTATLLLISSIFSAQAPDRLAVEGEWFVECPFDRLTGQRDCEVAVEVRSFDPPRHLAFVYRISSGMFMAVGLPTPSRIVARVDSGESFELAMCTGQACLLRGRFAARLRERMRHGSILRLEFHGVDRMAGVVDVDLSGFDNRHAEALARLVR
ncbi:MAG: hypothetical protein ACOY4R_13260 [Pseudomonadota bacterium]